MNTHREIDLPIKGSLASIYVSSFITAILVLIASAIGLLYNTTIYPTEQLARAFIPNDVVNLFIGPPILLGSMYLTWRGKLVGLFCWSSALFFVFYNYTAYVFAIPFNWVFPLHLTLMTLSLYTLVALLASINGKVVQKRLSGAVSERLAGGVLAGLGLLFILRVVGVLVTALSGGNLLTEPELAVNIADFVTTPAWVIGGILLWRQKELGYVTGLGLLFQGSMLFIAVIIFLLLQPLLTDTPFAITDMVVLFVMGLICFIPFGMFVRGVVKAQDIG